MGYNTTKVDAKNAKVRTKKSKGIRIPNNIKFGMIKPVLIEINGGQSTINLIKK